jgi:cation diffusion facilitator family transporter
VRVSTEGGTKAVVAALIANLGIAASKFVAYAFTGSSSMLSEAIHSVADSGNQVLLLVGGRRAKEGPDRQHQFGYGRRRYVYGFIVAIVLFLVGGLFSLYEGLHKVQHPEELADAWIAFLVLGIAIVLEGFSFRTALHESNKSRGRKSVFRFIRDSRQPELPVVLLEDAGALLGLVFALVGVTLATATGDGRWDGLGAMAVGTLLVVIAVFLAFEMASMLVGESALPEEQEAIVAALSSAEGIDRVIHVRTLHTGPDELLVAAKVAVEAQDTGAEIAAAIDAAERAVRAAVPSAQYIFIEPDLDRGGGPPPGASGQDADGGVVVGVAADEPEADEGHAT